MISDPRHRVQHRQLWIDKVRDQLDKTFPRTEDYGRKLRIQALANLTRANVHSLARLPPHQLAAEFATHGLTDPLPVVAMRALEACGYPQRLTRGGWAECESQVSAALNWCFYEILAGPQSHIMLLDDRTAKAVADSNNVPITAAELQHLPHNPCLIEFYRPIEIAEQVKRGVRVRAVGFQAIGSADAPAAVVCFYLDCWESQTDLGTKLPAKIGFWNSGYKMGHLSEGTRTQVGIEMRSDVEFGILEACTRVARNLWDFVTSRSIRYEHMARKPVRQSPGTAGPPRTPSRLDREVTFLFLSHDTKLPTLGNGPPRTTAPWDHRVEVPGTFHEFVYCAKCGDLHRHDLLGQACRKCGETVGPRANVRVEKYWHSPYVKGPEGTPLKDVIRDVLRQRRNGKK